MEETKPVREIIEEVQTEICDNYCKYTDGYKDADDEKYSDLIAEQAVKGGKYVYKNGRNNSECAAEEI